MRHGAHNVGKHVLLERLCAGDALGEVDVAHVPVQLFAKRPRKCDPRQSSLAVQRLSILLPVPRIQAQVVHNAESHHDGTCVVVRLLAVRVIAPVHGHQPVVEGEDALDVALADAAARARRRVKVLQVAALELIKCVLAHQVLTLDDEVGQVGQVGVARPPAGVGRALVDYPHLGKYVVSLLLLAERPIVPHEALQCGVELTDVVGATDPGLSGRQAVATVGIAGADDEDVARDCLYM